MKYVAKAHLTNDALGINVFPGDAVPEALVKQSPWVLDEGLVVTAKQHEAELAALAAQDAPEAADAVLLDQDDPEALDAASSGTEEG